MRKNKAFAAVIASILILFVLSGCSAFSDDMLKIPEIPERQKALIDAAGYAKGTGNEYSAPHAGINRQPIQLIDLDGDGEEEGIVFLRDIVETYKTSVYIFKRSGESFVPFSVISGKENEIYTVAYSSLLGNGYEMIIEWGSGEDKPHRVSVYGFSGGKCTSLLETDALRYIVGDTSGNGVYELLTVGSNGGGNVVNIYSVSDGELLHAGSVALSPRGGKLLGMRAGRYGEDKNGAFVDREISGGAVTDIIAFSNGKYANITPNGIVRNTAALCEDVNGDGVFEYPMATVLGASTPGAGGMYIWQSFSRGLSPRVCAFSYHSFAENWCMLLPVSWKETVVTERSISRSGQSVVRFFTRETVDGDEESIVKAPLFTVYVLTGDSREEYASRDGRFELARRGDTIFAAEIESSSYLGTDITEDFLKGTFKLRESDWIENVLFA